MTTGDEHEWYRLLDSTFDQFFYIFTRYMMGFASFVLEYQIIFISTRGIALTVATEMNGNRISIENLAEPMDVGHGIHKSKILFTLFQNSPKNFTFFYIVNDIIPRFLFFRLKDSN